MKSISWKRKRSESGAAVVEFALGVPILILFLMAAMEFGQISAASSAVDDAAHAAARELAIDPNGSADSAKEAALRAASSLSVDTMTLTTEIGEPVTTSYTHRLPETDGTTYRDRESNTAVREVTAEASVTIKPQTALGDGIYAIAGWKDGLKIAAKATEFKDATVEGGTSVW